MRFTCGRLLARHELRSPKGDKTVAEGLEQFQFRALRFACCHHLAVDEEAVAAAVCAVENAGVDAFKVEALDHRLPHEDVVERDAAHIHNKALHAGRTW